MKKRCVAFSVTAFFALGALLFAVFASTALPFERVKTASGGANETLTSFSGGALNDVKKSEALQKSLQPEAYNTRKYVYAGGSVIGIKLYCDGVVVVDTEAVETKNGKVSPAKLCGLLKGDLIKKIDGVAVKTNAEATKLIEKSGGKKMKFEVVRGEDTVYIDFCCVEDSYGGYKAGLWIRDSSAGIGTLTFVKEDGTFGSLGHAVCDVDTGEILPVGEGVVTNAAVTGIIKGSSGEAGEICGELNSEAIGDILKNTDTGIYGRLYSTEGLGLKKYPVAQVDEIKKGEAFIISTVETGKTELFKAEITDLNPNSTENKNLVVKITDEALIQKTGGIIQGMSGSPIIQNGMLVGAVTHVFINDPTSGYGIFIEEML